MTLARVNFAEGSQPVTCLRSKNEILESKYNELKWSCVLCVRVNIISVALSGHGRAPICLHAISEHTENCGE